MKVNEIITEAGIWQGVKNIGRGLGQVVGGAATSTVGFLDRMAGGSGDVGTTSQRLARKANLEKKLQKITNRNIPKQAVAYFASEMAKQGMNIDDPTTFNPQAMRQSLKDFALRFFAGGEDDKQVQAYIAQTLQFEPLPNKIDSKTLTNYFSEVNKIRANALVWVAQNQEQAAQISAKTQSAQPVLSQGVSVINSADPLILRYKNTDFALTPDDRWVYFGSTKETSPEMTQFLNRQLSKL